MTALDKAVEDFRVGLLLRAALDNRGSMCAAARAWGVHRNTARRILRDNGYDAAMIRQLLVIERARKDPRLAAKKPPAVVHIQEPHPRQFRDRGNCMQRRNVPEAALEEEKRA